ncbi:MAG: hypothetical protein H6Q64_538 [Firmicutes bacterium]|nr:hypothetical protein [Bacillota bacterium]
MIFYMADPMDLLQDIKTPEKRTINLPSGGLLNLEILDNQQARVAAIVSTDPMDYMNEDLQPGSILNINYVPK